MSTITVAILADETRKEIEGRGVPAGVDIIWVDSVQSLQIVEADAYFDLLFEHNHERISKLKFLLPKPVFVNDVTGTCEESDNSFIRINAWPTMLARNVIEVAFSDNSTQFALECLAKLGWNAIVVPDIPGMVTPRILSMIINEAFYALGEGVSTPQQIDTAMKLGTNYPYGPFEWLEKIGRGKVIALLERMADKDPKYTIAPLLKLN